jgi:hypothetical protein
VTVVELVVDLVAAVDPDGPGPDRDAEVLAVQVGVLDVGALVALLVAVGQPDRRQSAERVVGQVGP